MGATTQTPCAPRTFTATRSQFVRGIASNTAAFLPTHLAEPVVERERARRGSVAPRRVVRLRAKPLGDGPNVVSHLMTLADGQADFG